MINIFGQYHKPKRKEVISVKKTSNQVTDLKASGYGAPESEPSIRKWSICDDYAQYSKSIHFKRSKVATHKHTNQSPFEESTFHSKCDFLNKLNLKSNAVVPWKYNDKIIPLHSTKINENYENQQNEKVYSTTLVTSSGHVLSQNKTNNATIPPVSTLSYVLLIFHVNF